jgi:deoxyribonuclease-4
MVVARVWLKMSELLFGPAGVPLSARPFTTYQGVARAAELALGCMEVEFVQGVRMKAMEAVRVGRLATKMGIKLSVHAPYFINLNAREAEKIAARQQRIFQAAFIAGQLGARSLVFHAAFYLGDPPEQVYQVVKKNLAGVLARLKENNIAVLLRPEVTGKKSQFGTLDEVLALSEELEGVAPCIDFAHWHARTGANNSYSEFQGILRMVEARLGRLSLENMHIHVSGIAYNKKGENKHLLLEESDLNYEGLLRALKDKDVRGLIICESPNLEKDALLLQQTYLALC